MRMRRRDGVRREVHMYSKKSLFGEPIKSYYFINHTKKFLKIISKRSTDLFGRDIDADIL